MAQNVVVPPFDTAPEIVVGGTPQSVFAFEFPFWQAADVLVYVDGDALDPGAYTVEGFLIQNGSPVEGGYGSGEVTLNTPVANVTVTLDRFVVGDRETQFGRSAPLPMPTLNSDLNKLTARQQDIRRRQLQIEDDFAAVVTEAAAEAAAEVAQNVADDADRAEAAESGAVAAETEAEGWAGAAAASAGSAATERDGADAAKIDAQEAATQAAADLLAIQQIASGAPDAPSVLNKAFKDGSNVEAASFRTALELGDAALKDTGTAAGTLAAGDDSRIVGAAQKSSNLSDLTDADAAVENLGLTSRVYLSPLTFGAAGDGTTNDTTAWLGVIAAAKSTGLPIDGGNKLYGVNFSIFGGAGLGVNFSLRNARFKDLNPNQTTGSSRTLKFDGSGPTTSDWVSLENVKVDRNGGSVDTTLHVNVAIEFSNLGHAHISGSECFGNNAGELLRFENVGLITGDAVVRDAGYVHTSQTNDTVEGVVFTQIETAFFRVKVRRLGRTDRTVIQRSQHSRGVTIDRVRGGVIMIDVEQVGQGLDYSGNGASGGVDVVGRVAHCFDNGIKLAHAHYNDNVSGVRVEHVGRWPVIVEGPGDSEALPYQQMIRISGLSIIECGSNGYYKGLGSTTAGVTVNRNSMDSVRASFPKNVIIEGNVISSYTGSVVVTRSGGDLVMANGSFPVSTGKPVTFTTTGTLPTGLSLATTYWLGWDETSLTVRVATSYINALDGVFLTLSGGSGTHTMTGKSFMDYGGLIDGSAVKDRAAPNYFRNNIVVGATVSDSSGFAGTFAHIGTSSTQTLTDSTWTDLILNGVSPGADFLGKVDPDSLYNTSTGVFTLTAGVWNISGLVAYAANSTGIRDARISIDDGSGYKTLWPYRRIATPSATDPGEVAFQEVVRVGAAGALVKVQTRHSITGGGSLATHVNSRLSVEKVG